MIFECYRDLRAINGCKSLNDKAVRIVGIEWNGRFEYIEPT